MSTCRIDEANVVFDFKPITCYAIFSNALQIHNSPFFAVDDESAVKAIIDRAAAGVDASLMFGIVNGDLELRKLGTFDYLNLDVCSSVPVAFNDQLCDRLRVLRPKLFTDMEVN